MVDDCLINLYNKTEMIRLGGKTMFKKLKYKNKTENNLNNDLDLHNILNMLPSLWMEMVDGLKRKMPRIKGHYEGMQTIKTITREASNIGIKYLTLYAFSTELV